MEVKRIIKAKREDDEWILLKNGWRYNNYKEAKETDLIAPGRDRLNAPQGGFFHCKPSAGGSAILPENVKIDIGFDKVPAELIYGLWSVLVGSRGIAKCPFWFDNAQTHIPKTFKDDENKQKILFYTILYVFIDEDLNNRTNGMIGFKGIDKLISFGPMACTKGVVYLLDKFKDEKINGISLDKFLDKIKLGKMTTEKYKPFRKFIRDKLNKLLDEINYWDHIVIPKDLDPNIIGMIESIDFKVVE